jgi:hypothetical protein
MTDPEFTPWGPSTLIPDRLGLRPLRQAGGCSMKFRQTTLALGTGVALVSCGFADLLDSGKIGDVVIAYSGPVVVSVGDTVPISVTVTAGGTPLTGALLWITSSDTSIASLSARSDTLFARSKGFDTLTIRVVASIFTDSFPTLVQPIRVQP